MLATFQRGKVVLGHPEGDELRLINRFRPKGVPEYSSEDVVAAEFWASDNLIDRGLARWSPSLLADISSQAPGMPLIVDHHLSASSQHGMVYDSEIHSFKSAPTPMLSRSGRLKENRAVVRSEGWLRVKMLAFFPADDSVVRALESAQSFAVSTGGFVHDRVYECSECQQNLMLSDCPHLPPGFPLEWIAIDQSEYDAAAKRVARFSTTKGTGYDAVELSLTPGPAIPSAVMERNG